MSPIELIFASCSCIANLLSYFFSIRHTKKHQIKPRCDDVQTFLESDDPVHNICSSDSITSAWLIYTMAADYPWLIGINLAYDYCSPRIIDV